MQKIQGYSEKGNTFVTVAGIPATTKPVQGSYPSSTITIYLAGTLTLASIYSDDAAPPTAKANPFTAASDGAWFAYIPNGIYDVRFSGTGIVTPFTLGGFSLGLGDSGVPSYAFASIPATKTQGLGDLARVSDSIRGLWMDGVSGWAQLGYGLANAAEQPGADTGAKVQNARLAIGAAMGAIVVPPSMASDDLDAQLPDNIILIDFRGTMQSQGLRFNLPATLGPGAVRSKIFLQDNFNASTVGLAPNLSTATAYVFSYIDNPEVTTGAVAAFNATMAINSMAASPFNGVLIGVEGEAFANSTNAAARTCADIRGGTFNCFAGGNTIVNNARSLVAQAPVNQNPGTSVIHNAIGMYIEGFTGVGDTTNYPLWCTGLAVIDGVLALGTGPLAGVGLVERHSTLTGTSQSGILAAPIASSAATSSGVGVVGRCDTAAASFTQSINAGFYAQNPTKGAGSTITLLAGVYIENQTPGATNYGIYSLHTGDSFFSGPVESTVLKLSGATPTSGISGGRIAFGVTTISTIGPNGGASALTALPLGYMKINVNGTMAQIPYYNIA